VLLFFSDPDDYYTCISFFHKEGSHIQSSGIFIRGGYAHIAVPFIAIQNASRTLVHELAHNLLCHLPIPRWLNEGIACVIQTQMSGRQFILSREMASRHAGHWNETNIQTFWSGKSYHVPGDDSELSYSLGEILVRLVSDNGANFTDFIVHADWRDAGQDAALNVLSKDLGEVLGGFLGPGNWRPQRKAIAEQLRKPSAQEKAPD
jgi:hypothetical protein